jgi:ribosomal protein S18 acetylase RimI-like enzyme
MDELVIREVRPEDVEILCEIAVAAWTPIFASFRQILGDELFAAVYPDWREQKRGEVREACDSSDPAMVCVAQQGERVLGFVTFHTDPASGIGEIGNNAVHPDSQGRGIGPKMYEHVFDSMRAMGMRFVRVSTGLDPSHAPARRAYEKAGFSIRLPGVDYYRKL